jgi:Flp pilus assembly protein TadB
MTTTRDPAHDVPDRSTGQLLSDLSAQTSRLIRDEMRLAQKEFQQSAKHAGIGGGLIGTATLLLVFALGAAVAAVIAALALLLPVWAAALITAVLLLVGAGIAALISRSEARRVPPPMQESVDSVKQDIQTVKEAGK